MNKSNNWKTGQIGENLAAKFLEEKGYEILSRNYRTRFGEIDIIATTEVTQGCTKPRAEMPREVLRDRSESSTGFVYPESKKNKIYVFVEVKTKIGDQFGAPEEMINSSKIAKVLKMACVYLTKEGLGEPPCRLDVIAIVLNDEMKVVSLHHYPSITK